LNKVSLATGVPAHEFQDLASEDISDLFGALDTDLSGTISFEEFTNGLMQIRLARKREVNVNMEETHMSMTADMAWQIVKKWPPLQEKEKALVDQALAKLRSRGIELLCTPHNVVLFLNECYLWGDERAARMLIQRAFPGRDLASIDTEDWYDIYQEALHDQPMWTKLLTKSMFSREPLTAKDMQNHESMLRDAYGRYAGRTGGMEAEDVGRFFTEVGLLEYDGAPKLLADFERKRKPGLVFFPEVV